MAPINAIKVQASTRTRYQLHMVISMLILLHLIKDLFLETTSIQGLENNTNGDYTDQG